jgi:hypothetical protein
MMCHLHLQLENFSCIFALQVENLSYYLKYYLCVATFFIIFTSSDKYNAMYITHVNISRIEKIAHGIDKTLRLHLNWLLYFPILYNLISYEYKIRTT